MNKIALILISILVMGCNPSTDEVTTFILVRHAEKSNDGTDDPQLSDEGRERANRLAFMLQGTPLTAVYSTDYKRTRTTVQSVADAQHLEVNVYEAFNPEVIKEITDSHRGGTVLVSGHSNTTPWTANLLIGEATYADYAETEYGIVLIVSVTGVGMPVSVTRINY